MKLSLKPARSVLEVRPHHTLLPLGVVIWLLLACSDPTGPKREPRNTFTDWQHIQGKVCGVWTKDHNPHVITGIVKIEDGDSLVVQPGVEIIFDRGGSMYLNLSGKSTSRIQLLGSDQERIRVSFNTDSWAPITLIGGRTEFKYVIFEGNGKAVSMGGGGRIEKCLFSESAIIFSFVNSTDGRLQTDTLNINSNIFAGLRQQDLPGIRYSFETGSGAYLDSSLTIIRNNLFFGSIGTGLDSTGISIVNVSLKGLSGIHIVSALTWPGNGNIFANPKWVSYSYVGPNPTGISSNDYHLQPGSPAIGAGVDGGNIGAY